MSVLQDLIEVVARSVTALDPGIALVVFVLTMALDGLHIVYTRLVMARRAFGAANSGAATYLIYAFAIIESTHNWSYVAIMAAGSWLGTYLALRLAPGDAVARRNALPASGELGHLLRVDGRVDGRLGGLGSMRRHVGDDAADMRVGGGVEHLLTLPLGAQHAGRPQQPQMMTDEGWRELGAARDVRDANRRRETGEDDLQAARIAHQAKHLGERQGLGVGH